MQLMMHLERLTRLALIERKPLWVCYAVHVGVGGVFILSVQIVFLYLWSVSMHQLVCNSTVYCVFCYTKNAPTSRYVCKRDRVLLNSSNQIITQK